MCLGECADKSKTVDDLFAALPEHECRYVVYEHSYKRPDGRPQDKLFFVTWLPRSVNPTDKMLYSTARKTIRESTPGCFDLTAGTKGELVDGIVRSGGGSKDDDEASDAGDDWMDS